MKSLLRARVNRGYSLTRLRGSGVILPTVLSSLLIVSFLSSIGEAQTRYKIIHIPTPDGCNSTALGLNEQGNVIGYCYQSDESNAFLYSYSTGTITDLGSLGGNATAATAINNSNQIVGYSADATGNVLAFLYAQNQAITSLGTLTGWKQ